MILESCPSIGRLVVFLFVLFVVCCRRVHTFTQCCCLVGCHGHHGRRGADRAGVGRVSLCAIQLEGGVEYSFALSVGACAL